METNHLPQYANLRDSTQLSCKCNWYLSGLVWCNTSTLLLSMLGGGVVKGGVEGGGVVEGIGGVVGGGVVGGVRGCGRKTSRMVWCVFF